MQLDIQAVPAGFVAMSYGEARDHEIEDHAEFNRGWEAYMNMQPLNAIEYSDWQKGWWMALAAEAHADIPMEEQPGFTAVWSVPA